MGKVIAIYGGVKWVKIENRFLLGASNSYKINSTGGEATHKLTINEMPSHGHNYTTVGLYQTIQNYVEPLNDPNKAIGKTSATTVSTGSNAAHNNMPPYRAVYIWERTK